MSSSQFNSCRLEKIMDLPPSSLLGRLQAFLPEIEKANQTTQKLVEEGKLEVLDDHLEVAGTEQEKEEAEETDEEDEDDERAEQEGTATEDGSGAGAVPPRTVQLDFALGDFDHTPIAKMEMEKETEEQAAKIAAGTSSGDEADEAGDGPGDGGIENLVRVPLAHTTDTAPREKPRKPLIEEI